MSQGAGSRIKSHRSIWILIARLFKLHRCGSMKTLVVLRCVLGNPAALLE
jgi:hypothetical protein